MHRICSCCPYSESIEHRLKLAKSVIDERMASHKSQHYMRNITIVVLWRICYFPQMNLIWKNKEQFIIANLVSTKNLQVIIYSFSYYSCIWIESVTKYAIYTFFVKLNTPQTTNSIFSTRCWKNTEIWVPQCSSFG